MYDPLLDNYPEAQQAYPDSFWASTIHPPAVPSLEQTQDVDIAVIGGGFTGLSSAWHLTQQTDAKIAVLEANNTGWGCSGRNAGFVLPGTGRLSVAQMRKKWGNEVAGQIYREYFDSIDTVRRLIVKGNIDCDMVASGYLKLAHTEKLAGTLQQQAEMLSRDYGEKAEYLRPDEVSDRLLSCHQSFGGIYFEDCFALNPLKLAQGYTRLVQEQSVDIFANSPVTRWEKHGSTHQLHTPTGQVNAKTVIVATNGYTGKALHPLVNKRHFPVLSSIIVTPPLTEEQRAALGVKAGLMAMDTRPLKYYYRMLPDGRLLFGGRGAVLGKDADKDKYRQHLLDGLRATFPPLADIDAAYFWSGWVSVSLDDYPRLWHSDDNSIHYAMGYCGAGVAFAAQAGKRLAQQVLNPGERPALPFWQSPLKRFPFASMRRMGLRAFYAIAGRG